MLKTGYMFPVPKKTPEWYQQETLLWPLIFSDTKKKKKKKKESEKPVD